MLPLFRGADRVVKHQPARGARMQTRRGRPPRRGTPRATCFANTVPYPTRQRNTTQRRQPADTIRGLSAPGGGSLRRRRGAWRRRAAIRGPLAALSIPTLRRGRVRRRRSRTRVHRAGRATPRARCAQVPARPRRVRARQPGDAPRSAAGDSSGGSTAEAGPATKPVGAGVHTNDTASPMRWVRDASARGLGLRPSLASQ
jgi:hypothetical protein